LIMTNQSLKHDLLTCTAFVFYDFELNKCLQMQLKKEGRRNEFERHKLQALNQRQKMVSIDKLLDDSLVLLINIVLLAYQD